jgi:pyruvate/2-oxoacid:ferredoxin oxidoreductase alpha subunit
MSINPTESPQVKVITGNAAAAIGATLCRPDVIAAYPITPQTEIIDKLSEFHSRGILDAEMITVEGENSAMNAVTAASIAGGRVFTASSSWGLAFMYDAVLAAAGTRAPVVMVNVNREPPGIMAVSSGQQDMICTRDSGWIFLIAEDSQEILDMVIMAYRLAEDHDIQLPVMVHYDGFYLSYMAERVEIPTDKDVDEYLAVLKEQPQRPRLVPGKPMGIVTHGILDGYVELRYKHCKALERAKQKFDQINGDFNKRFGRAYEGQVETYRCDDADIVLVGSGSMCGTIKTVIDQKRDEGTKVGLVRLRMYRPFPEERLVEALKGRKAIGVVDRSLCFGFKGGPIYTEIRSLSSEFGGGRMLSFIDGLANMDITTAHIEKIIDTCLSASNGASCDVVTWVSSEG